MLGDPMVTTTYISFPSTSLSLCVYAHRACVWVRYEASQIPDIVVSPNQRRLPQAPAPAPATAAVPDHRAGGDEIDAITAFRDWQQHQVRV